MRDKKGFDVAIGAPRKIMQLLGIWPDPKRKENYLFRYYVLIPSLIMLCFCIVPQTVEATRVWGDFNAVIRILTITDISVIISLFKMLTLWYKRNVLSQLVIAMVEDWKRTKTQRELHIMWANAKLSRKMSITIIVLAEGTIFTHSLMILIIMISDVRNYDLKENNTSETVKSLFFDAEFPYNEQKSPYYEITCIFELLSILLAASAFSAVDAFFAVLVLHLCSQLKNLRESLRSLPEESSIKGNQTFIQMLSKLVIRQEYLERFANAIEESFNVMFLVQMLMSSAVLCLQGYQLIMITTTGDKIPLMELIFMMYFTLCFSFSLFVYCYVAEVLRTESMAIGNAIYESDWYNLAPIKSKNLLLVMIRVKQPYKITAGKFVEFSLQHYCRILKSTGGYLSMLIAMKSRLGS